MCDFKSPKQHWIQHLAVNKTAEKNFHLNVIQINQSALDMCIINNLKNVFFYTYKITKTRFEYVLISIFFYFTKPFSLLIFFEIFQTKASTILDFSKLHFLLNQVHIDW